MSVISTGTVGGPEARGTASIVASGGVAEVQLTDFWIVPGAPDVRLYVSPRADGVVDDTAIDLGKIPDGEPELTRNLPADINPATIRSVIVQCTVFNVLFGFGVVTPT